MKFAVPYLLHVNEGALLQQNSKPFVITVGMNFVSVYRLKIINEFFC